MCSVLCVYSGDPIILFLVFISSLVAKITRFSSPGLVVIGNEALGAIYCISEHGCTSLLKKQTSRQYHTVIFN